MTRRSVRAWLAAALLVGAMAVGAIAVLSDPIAILWYMAYAIAGTVLIVRRPTNPIGWLLLLIMVGFMGATDLTPEEIAAIGSGTAAPSDAFQVWLGAVSGTWVFVGYGVLAMILPTGRFPTGRWRRPAIALLAVNAALAVLTAFAPRISVTVDGGARTVFVRNPLAVAAESPIWSVLPDADIAFAPVLVVLVAGVASILVRYARATGLLRMQLRWIVAAMTFTVVAVLAGFAILFVGGETTVGFVWIPASLAFLSIPLAIMVAVLRYRLLEIDRIVSRTIGWGLASGVLAAIFVAGTLGLQALLADVTQGETIAVAASTLAAAAFFQPVRRPIQRAVDRRFDRSRYDRDLVAATFGSRLRDELDLTMLRSTLIDTSAAAMRPVSVALWLRARSGPG